MSVSSPHARRTECCKTTQVENPWLSVGDLSDFDSGNETASAVWGLRHVVKDRLSKMTNHVNVFKEGKHMINPLHLQTCTYHLTLIQLSFTVGFFIIKLHLAKPSILVLLD